MICNDMLGGKNKNYKNNIQEMNVILRLARKQERNFCFESNQEPGI